MNARSLARLLVIVALACAGLVLVGGVAAAQQSDGQVVQNGNNSEDSSATSADVTAGNETILQAGPAATDGGRAAMVGDTNTSIDQESGAHSGPASAGSQLSDGRRRRNQPEQNTNRSVGAEAESGPVESFNSIDAHNGPFASGEGASAVASGGSTLDISQNADGESGPARAGSQLIDSGALTQNLNVCGDAVSDCGETLSGDVEVENAFGASDADDFPVPSGAGPVAFSDDGESVFAGIVGETDAVITQKAVGLSGDAFVGSQEIGGRGGVHQDENRAAEGESESGPVAVENFATAFVGPFGFGVGNTSAQQFGDASGDLDQDTEATSGRAVTGSQLEELTGEQSGALAVQNRSASEDDTAVTGAAEAASEVEAFAGPVALGLDEDASARLAGDAQFDIDTETDAISGDAFAGSLAGEERGGAAQNDNSSSGGDATSGDAISEGTVEAVAGPMATADAEPADAVQDGDSEVDVDLEAESESGVAGVGSQFLDARGDATTQNGNLSADDSAESGDAITDNDVSGVAGAVAGEPFIGTADAPASAALSGEADFGADLEARATSGDALTGSQLVDARGRSAVLNENDSEENDSLSGEALAGNALDGIAGPFAGLADPILSGDLSAAQAGDALSRAVMDGDAEVDADLESEAITGDARSGVQDSEVRGSATVANENSAADSTAQSADACADLTCTGEIVDEFDDSADVPGGNRAVLFAGPVAGGAGDSSAALSGDADARLGQEAKAESLAATASSQVDEARGRAVVENSNDSEGALAEGEQVTAGNLTQAFVGPLAFAGDGVSASAVQSGDANLRGGASAQEAEARNGETVAGSQFTDNRRRSTVQNDNTAVDAEALAGPVTAFNATGVDPFDPENEEFVTVVGPAAFAFAEDARAALDGDATLRIDQEVEAELGDAISGSQLARSGRRDAAQVSNDSDGDEADAGDALGFNAAGGSAGPLAVDGDAVQAGDVRVRFDQEVEIEAEEDELAGSQVIGRFRGIDNEDLDDPDEDGVVEFSDDGDALTAAPIQEPISFGSEDPSDGLSRLSGWRVGPAFGHEAA